MDKRVSRLLVAMTMLTPVTTAAETEAVHVFGGVGYAAGTTQLPGGSEVDDTKQFVTLGADGGAPLALGGSVRIGTNRGDGAINDGFVDFRPRAGFRNGADGIFVYGQFSFRMSQWDFPMLYGGGASAPIPTGEWNWRVFGEYMIGDSASGGVSDLVIDSYTEWSTGVRYTFR